MAPIAWKANTGIILRVFSMQLLRKLFVRMSLYAQCFPNGEDLEQEREFFAIFFTDLQRQEGLIVLDEIQERTLSRDILGRQRGMGAHP